MRRVALAALLMALASCAAEPKRYAWGHYEGLIYSSYAKPGKLTPQDQVQILQKDFQYALAKSKPVPPGWHAHLGYLYYQTGRVDQARQELLNEKVAFPESAVFMDRLLANLK